MSAVGIHSVLVTLQFLCLVWLGDQLVHMEVDTCSAVRFVYYRQDYKRQKLILNWEWLLNQWCLLMANH